MVTLGSGAREEIHLPETPQRQETTGKEDLRAQKISGYEQSREERIRENLERMEKLGILDLSLKLKSLKPTPNRASHRRNYHASSPLPPPSGPVRRSSRLQNSTPVSYSEVQMSKNDKSLEREDWLREAGSRPEVYTEEHEKLLGSTEMSWTLFIDGYGKDGKRIYDPVRGKTCHQCRQKTLGHRTHCSKCNMVQGQFCGDCLYMRYGENVLEANKNPNWICPVCRGICNCSLCRLAKGWPPTGTLYRKISSLGYKSVAHYLIQTKRAKTDSDENDASEPPTKRSLPFSDIEVTTKEDLAKSDCEHTEIDPFPNTSATNDEFNVKITEEITYSSKEVDDGKIAVENGENPLEEKPITADQSKVEFQLNPVSGKEEGFRVVDCDGSIYVELKISAEPLTDPFLSDYDKSLSVPETLEKRGDGNDIKKEECMILENKISIAPETSPKPSKKFVPFEVPTPDSIARRLRSKSKTNEEINVNVSTRSVEGTPRANDSTAGRLTRKRNARVETEDSSTIADGDSIARRLKMRRRV